MACAESARSALAKVEGVRDVTVSLESGSARVVVDGRVTAARLLADARSAFERDGLKFKLSLLP